MKYQILTVEIGTDEWTPQKGIPEFVDGFRGLRMALRALRALGYQATRGDAYVRVTKVEAMKDAKR